LALAGEVQAPASRNSPCPCGSGKRFKECHGALTGALPATPADTVLATLKEAAERLRQGDVRNAETLARNVLVERAGRPEALRILARCAYEQGSPRDGLTLALDAARSMQTQPVDPATGYLIWSDLGFMFGVALVGIDSALASKLRTAYAQRPANPDAELGSATVSVVVIATESGARLAETLHSVAVQTCRDIEVIVAYAGADPRSDPEVEATVAAWQRDARWLKVPDARPAALAEAGVRVAKGALVNVLPVPHRFAPTRIDTMREALARRGAGWGFSGAAFVNPAGASIPAERDWLVRAGMDRLSAIGESDTVGHALIHQDFVAVDAGNLMFRRSLHAEIGGFRADAPLWAWEFCLHAVLEDEPVFVPTREFVHVTVAASPLPPAQSRDYEAAQLGMFGGYYAFACTDTAVRNPFAPCVANWGLGFLKNVFHSGHVLALPLPELERLGAAVLARFANPSESSLAPGIDLVGFAFGEFGLGENLRAFARACERDAIPFIVRDVDLRLKTRQADRSIAAHVSEVLRHGCALYCLNPDMMKPVRPLLVESAAVGRRNIGYWFWELEQVPAQWAQSIADIDEIWVATEFIATAMRHATDKPVVKIPTPIDVAMSRAYARSEFGLPDDRFLFLFSFDFNSFAARKNPEAAIRAFQHAFARERRDVGLVVKSINGRNKPEAVRAIRDLIGGDDRVVIVDEFFSRDEVSGLQSVVDAYVSLHRAEGLGLGLAESMYLGKPVIGTRYSGNLEFMDDANSCLVDCTLVPIRKGEYLYDDERFRWAEPDVEHAAHWMARLADDTPFRTRIAERGRSDIRTRFTYASAAALMRRRLSALGLL
jgi:glycosyltransferase involved in cell wall biosynthesis